MENPYFLKTLCLFTFIFIQSKILIFSEATANENQHLNFNVLIKVFYKSKRQRTHTDLPDVDNWPRRIAISLLSAEFRNRIIMFVSDTKRFKN